MVGGKRESFEEGIQAAYREMKEETGIGKESISLLHVMDFVYHIHGIVLEVYGGILVEKVDIFGEESQLLWIEDGEDFFDPGRFAGEGNIGHLLFHTKEALGIKQK